MLNEFIEKVVVHEGEGRGNSRRQRIDIYLNFIGAFEVPRPYRLPQWKPRKQRRQQEEQAAKEARSQELAKAREEKRKAEKREFTARKKAGLLTPEEQAADEARLAHNRAWQKEWRKKRKAAEPPKSPKPKSLRSLPRCKRPEPTSRRRKQNALPLTARGKTTSTRHGMTGRKQRSRPSPGRSKSLPPRKSRDSPHAGEAERLEASRSRKKNAYQELKAQAETDPAAAAELARRRAYHSEATKKSARRCTRKPQPETPQPKPV